MQVIFFSYSFEKLVKEFCSLIFSLEDCPRKNRFPRFSSENCPGISFSRFLLGKIPQKIMHFSFFPSENRPGRLFFSRLFQKNYSKKINFLVFSGKIYRKMFFFFLFYWKIAHKKISFRISIEKLPTKNFFSEFLTKNCGQKNSLQYSSAIFYRKVKNLDKSQKYAKILTRAAPLLV